MANLRINDLAAAAALTGAELLEVEQDDTGLKNRKTTAQDIADLAPKRTTIDGNVQTASYTLALSDAGKAVEMNVADANTVTVPPNASVAFPVGTVIEVCQVGSGQTTIVNGSGVTIQTPETLVLAGQWSTVSIRQRAADVWVLAGDVEVSP